MEYQPELSIRIATIFDNESLEELLRDIRVITPNVGVKFCGYNEMNYMKVLLFYRNEEDYNMIINKFKQWIPSIVKPEIMLNFTYYEITEHEYGMIMDKTAVIWTGEEWRDEHRTYNIDNENEKSIKLFDAENKENINAIRMSDFWRK